ncbi:hypothetical protein HMN09_00996900 [Mycena chlorophos]|uniref:F-box domain-containing protein n=1 Tax=Mycena chlorophos TaxID=658473 RepID=A0A8H6SHV1_MYCCL|nr:hypothetical protein HMN09_00996900 [Mycena chlorophos]
MRRTSSGRGWPWSSIAPAPAQRNITKPKPKLTVRRTSPSCFAFPAARTGAGRGFRGNMRFSVGNVWTCGGLTRRELLVFGLMLGTRSGSRRSRRATSSRPPLDRCCTTLPSSYCCRIARLGYAKQCFCGYASARDHQVQKREVEDRAIPPSTPPAMAAFPQELLDVFVSHIHPSDRTTLKACSLVAPFREASQRRLWEIMTLRICVVPNTLKTSTDVLYPPQRLVSLKDAAKKADEWPHLFRHIQKIVVVDTKQSSSLGAREVALLRRVLGRTDGVVAASFIYASTKVLELLLEFASGWTTLREVRIMGHRDVPVDALVRLSTCGIHRLFLDGCLLAQTSPSSTTSLSAGVAGACTLTALKVHAPDAHEDDYQHLCDTLTRSVVPLTTSSISELGYEILMDRRNTLGAAYARTLERLHISAEGMSDMDYLFDGTSGISFPEVLPQLRYVRFEIMFRMVDEHWLYEAVDALLDSASARVPKLECIEFQVYVYARHQYAPGTVFAHDDAADLMDLPLGLTLRDKEHYQEFPMLLQYLDDSLPTGVKFLWCTMQMQPWVGDHLWDERREFEEWMHEAMPNVERDGRLEFGVERAVFE